MFADHLRSAIEAAPRLTLPAVTAQLWRAYGEGQVTEAEAEALSGLIEARQGQSPKAADEVSAADIRVAADRLRHPRQHVGSRPRSDASMERRRRWAASGRIPPALAARFTLAEQAVLSLVASEIARRKDCRLAIENIAAVAGVSRSTVKSAIREAVRLGLVTVEERQITGWRNDTNIVRIVAPEWVAWLRLTRKRPNEGLSLRNEQKGGGVKTPTTTPTVFPNQGSSGATGPSQGLPRGSGRPRPKRAAKNRRGW